MEDNEYVKNLPRGVVDIENKADRQGFRNPLDSYMTQWGQIEAYRSNQGLKNRPKMATNAPKTLPKNIYCEKGQKSHEKIDSKSELRWYTVKPQIFARVLFSLVFLIEF